MIRIKNRKTGITKRTLLLLIAACLVCAVSVLSLWYFAFREPTLEETNRQETEHIDKTSTVKESQVQNNNTDTGNLPSKTDADNKPVNTDSQTPQNPPEKPRIERASGTPTIRVVATFQQASEGYCELTFRHSASQRESQTSRIVIGSTYYTCSFDIPRNSLQPQDGWTATVIHRAGSASTSSDTVEL